MEDCFTDCVVEANRFGEEKDQERKEKKIREFLKIFDSVWETKQKPTITLWAELGKEKYGFSEEEKIRLLKDWLNKKKRENKDFDFTDWELVLEKICNSVEGEKK